jgi:Uma2 family endonuclease
MGLAAQKSIFSASDFLAWDATQTVRHEFFNGEVFAMAGGTDAHSIVSGNVYMALRHHLAGTPCRVFNSDVKLQVEQANSFFYPDVFVTCSSEDAHQPLLKNKPELIVEVLSESTAAYDRGRKFEAYRKLPTLREFVIVDPTARQAETYRKGEEGLWVLHPFAFGQGLELTCFDLKITAAQLFADLDAQSAPKIA